jgi:hypothetical protein
MFESIKGALQTKDAQSNFRDIMKFEVGKTYNLRMLPDIKDPSKTFFHYYNHAWESFSTGQFLSVVSPSTWGERDPISEARFSILKHGTEEEKEKAQKITRRENWLANVYVVDDQANPDNNGKVKIMRFGRQLHKIITEAIEGEDSDVFGPKIFDLGKEGVSLKVKCERQGDFPTYVSSKFGPTASAIPGMDKEAEKEVYDNVHDLEAMFPVKSYDELKQTLDEHYHCKDTSAPVETPDKEEEDDLDYGDAGKTKTPAVVSKKTKDQDDPLDDDKVKELLDGLNS